jgi:dynein heavy chain
MQFSFQKVHSLNNRKAGKYTEDPIKNLPQLPEKRLKPTWNDPNAKFIYGQNEGHNDPSGFDIMKELASRDPKKYKMEEMKSKKPTTLKSLNSSAKSSDHAKKSREEFRRSLVDIIM